MINYTEGKLMDHSTEREQSAEEWSMFQTHVVDILKPVLQMADDQLLHREYFIGTRDPFQFGIN